ncbi:MAG: diacylglycerol/lipid kinase family protein [bacterium]
MQTPHRLVFFANPGAREGRVISRLRAVLKKMPVLAEQAETVCVRSHDEIRSALRQMRSDAIPVAVGGDGTINMLVRALREENMGARPVGVLPFGTGNAFAHAIGVGKIPRALAALASQEVSSLDLMVTTHPEAPIALVSISTGFESKFLWHYANWRKWTPLGGGLLSFFRTSASTCKGITLTCDDTPLVAAEERIYNAGLYNMPCYAFGRTVFPDANPADGLAYAIACPSTWIYWKTLLKGFRQNQPAIASSPRARNWHSAYIKTGGPVQVDGEVIAGGAFHVRLEPKALNVLV